MALKPSETLAVTEKIRALRAQGIDVVGFGAGEPDFDTPEHVKQAAFEALRGGDTKYPTPASGRIPLREAICEYLQRFGGLSYRPSQVCVSVGVKDALYLALQALLNPDDEAIIPAPYWVSYPDQVALAGGKAVVLQPAAGPGAKFNAADVRRALTPRTRVLIMNSPSNPSGVVYSRDELQAIADALRDTSVIVLSDEIYHRLTFDPPPAASFAGLPGMFERTLTVNGFSKTYAMTGWRLGYAAGPEPLIKTIGSLIGQTTSGAPSFIQTAAIAAVRGEQECVEKMRLAYRDRARRMCRRLDAMPGVRCPMPEGAFFCFPDVSGTFERLGVKDADGFAAAVLERAHVALVSGNAFGCPTHARLSFATSDAQIDAGLDRLERLLRE